MVKSLGRRNNSGKSRRSPLRSKRRKGSLRGSKNKLIGGTVPAYDEDEANKCTMMNEGDTLFTRRAPVFGAVKNYKNDANLALSKLIGWDGNVPRGSAILGLGGKGKVCKEKVIEIMVTYFVKPLALLTPFHHILGEESPFTSRPETNTLFYEQFNKETEEILNELFNHNTDSTADMFNTSNPDFPFNPTEKFQIKIELFENPVIPGPYHGFFSNFNKIIYGKLQGILNDVKKDKLIEFKQTKLGKLICATKTLEGWDGEKLNIHGQLCNKIKDLNAEGTPPKSSPMGTGTGTETEEEGQEQEAESSEEPTTKQKQALDTIVKGIMEACKKRLGDEEKELTESRDNDRNNISSAITNLMDKDSIDTFFDTLGDVDEEKRQNNLRKYPLSGDIIEEILQYNTRKYLKKVCNSKYPEEFSNIIPLTGNRLNRHYCNRGKDETIEEWYYGKDVDEWAELKAFSGKGIDIRLPMYDLFAEMDKTGLSPKQSKYMKSVERWSDIIDKIRNKSNSSLNSDNIKKLIYKAEMDWISIEQQSSPNLGMPEISQDIKRILLSTDTINDGKIEDKYRRKLNRIATDEDTHGVTETDFNNLIVQFDAITKEREVRTQAYVLKVRGETEQLITVEAAREKLRAETKQLEAVQAQQKRESDQKHAIKQKALVYKHHKDLAKIDAELKTSSNDPEFNDIVERKVKQLLVSAKEKEETNKTEKVPAEKQLKINKEDVLQSGDNHTAHRSNIAKNPRRAGHRGGAGSDDFLINDDMGLDSLNRLIKHYKDLMDALQNNRDSFSDRIRIYNLRRVSLKKLIRNELASTNDGAEEAYFVNLDDQVLGKLESLISIHVGFCNLPIYNFDMWHMAIAGPSGCGKTSFVRKYFNILKKLNIISQGINDFEHYTVNDLIGSNRQDTQDKVLEAIKKSYSGLLFIDEAHSLGSPWGAGEITAFVQTLMTKVLENRNKSWKDAGGGGIITDCPPVLVIAGYSDDPNENLPALLDNAIVCPDFPAPCTHDPKHEDANIGTENFKSDSGFGKRFRHNRITLPPTGKKALATKVFNELSGTIKKHFNPTEKEEDNKINQLEAFLKKEKYFGETFWNKYNARGVDILIEKLLEPIIQVGESTVLQNIQTLEKFIDNTIFSDETKKKEWIAIFNTIDVSKYNKYSKKRPPDGRSTLNPGELLEWNKASIASKQIRDKDLDGNTRGGKTWDQSFDQDKAKLEELNTNGILPPEITEEYMLLRSGRKIRRGGSRKRTKRKQSLRKTKRKTKRKSNKRKTLKKQNKRISKKSRTLKKA